MKKTLMAVLAAAMVGNLAFAQVSRTNAATKGLFGNDTDAFMDVNNWDSVEPENLFAVMYYENSALSAGAAHEFENFYLGFFGYGIMETFSSNKVTTGGDSTTTVKSDTLNKFGFEGLFGLYDVGGIKLSFDFQNNGSNQTVSDKDKKVGNKNYYMNIKAAYGFNSEWNDKKLSPVFEVYYETATDKTFNTSADPQTTSDSSVSAIGLSAATGIAFPKKGFAEQNVGLKLDTAFGIIPKDNLDLSSNPDFGFGPYEKQSGISAFQMTFTPDYTATFTPVEKMSLKVNAALPVYFGAVNGPTSVTSGGVETTIDGDNRVKYTLTTIKPELKAAMVYNLKENFQINAGASFALGSLQINTEKGPLTDSSTLTFADTTKPVTFSSGFAWKPFGEKLVLDCTYEILAGLFGNDLSSDLTTGASVPIWNNLNKMFVHNLTIGVSSKF